MFDLAWSEIMLIGAVALIAIGPKELPNAIRTVSGLVKKAREMAWEFRGHLDEVVREANLDEVRDQFNQIRNFDLKGEVEKTVDPGGSLRKTVQETGLSMQDFMQHDPLAPKTPHMQTGDAASAAEQEHAPLAGDLADHTAEARSVTADDISSEPPEVEGPDSTPEAPSEKSRVPDFVPPEIAAVVLTPRPAFVPPDIPRG